MTSSDVSGKNRIRIESIKSILTKCVPFQYVYLELKMKNVGTLQKYFLYLKIYFKRSVKLTI